MEGSFDVPDFPTLEFVLLGSISHNAMMPVTFFVPTAYIILVDWIESKTLRNLS